MYGHQSMPRSVSAGQLNAMMSHPGMVITSQQMINTPQGVMVSQAGYPQGMINTAQPPPQMMPSQAHMGQQMMNTHLGVVQGLNQSSHISAQHQQMQSMQQVQMTPQQAYIQHQQHQQGMSHPNFVNGQARSPAVGPGPQGMSQGTPGGPPSTGGPPSNNPQTPLNAISSLNPSSQQVSTPATPQQAPSSVQSTTTQENMSTPTIVPPDPVSLARNLLLRDLRYSLQEWSKTAAEVIRPLNLRQQQDGSGATTTHNPMSVNPQSVNPQSVNPQSVNPLSANPSSVKSLDEPKSVENLEKKILSPSEAYINSFDYFLGTCDQIENDIMVVQEAQKQSVKFDKMFAGELKIVGEMANVNYSQYAQGYVESTARVRNAITRTLKNLNATMERMNASKIVSYKENCV
uniref:Mediator of RNA polymerase II transcription subunit 29 n=1 Tax=Setaria digitata TaxID=48799 RepID=A0A915Q4E4_9BILA